MKTVDLIPGRHCIIGSTFLFTCGQPQETLCARARPKGGRQEPACGLLGFLTLYSVLQQNSRVKSNRTTLKVSQREPPILVQTPKVSPCSRATQLLRVSRNWRRNCLREISSGHAFFHSTRKFTDIDLRLPISCCLHNMGHIM